MAKAIICDLDGTIALMGERGPFEWHRVSEDVPNPAVIDLMRRYYDDHSIMIVSGRSDECHIKTLAWLARHEVPYDHLFMRHAGDFRKDAVLKREIYDRHIAGRYEVAFCLDDRNQSVAFWRELGLVCFQVALGDF